MSPAAIIIGRNAVAEQLVGALARDPVVPLAEPEPAVRQRALARIAAALRSTADRLAPADRPAAEAAPC
jgi:hypothetical protein